jgi:hypothetical protein
VQHFLNDTLNLGTPADPCGLSAPDELILSDCNPAILELQHLCSIR